MAEQQDFIDALKAYVDAGENYEEAHRQTGIPISTLKYRVKAAVRKNLAGTAFGGETPPGYSLGKITQMYKSDDGKVLEWRHLQPEALGEQYVTALEEWAKAAITPLPPIAYFQPSDVDPFALTVYPIPDVHLGQYSWGKETGNSYDLDIAVSTVKSTFAKLVEKTPPSATAVVLGLGDFFHADGNDARTPKSQNALDVDSRYGKVQWMGAELMIQTVDLALQKHQKVIVKVLPGNHDPRGGDALTIALWFRYLGNPRVEVDRLPALHWFYQWGETMLAAHHGHETKPEQMPGVMSAYEPKMWGDTQYRYALLGHWHKRAKGFASNESNGAVWEIFQAITAKDAWNRGKGHASGRSITAITYDMTDGEVNRTIVPISPK